jgi:Sulfotransferase family
VTKQWPNLYIVGAAKSGTTSLYHYLRQHPDVFMPSYKEPHFFSRVKPKPELEVFLKHISGEAEYLNLFDKTSAKIIGEASTSYLWDKDTPQRIAQVAPDAKIIIMLRQPVERAFSHYLNNVREAYEKRDFHQAILEDLQATEKGWGISSLYVDLGYYCEQVERYLTVFGKNVHVIFFEEFTKDIPAQVEQVFKFLEIDPGYARKVEPEVRNPYARPSSGLSKWLLGTPAVRRLVRALSPASLRPMLRSLLLKKDTKPVMASETLALLNDVYKDQALCLETLLHRNVPWTEAKLSGTEKERV